MLWMDIIRGIIFLGFIFFLKGEYLLIFLVLLFIFYGSGVFFNLVCFVVMLLLELDIKSINMLFVKVIIIFIIVGVVVGGFFLLGGFVELVVVFNGVIYLILVIFISCIKL